MSSKIKTIHEAWAEYSCAIYNGMQVSSTQYDETKQAFMAGALVVLKTCEEIGDPDISEQEGVSWMSEAMDECVEYHRNRIKSRTERN